MFPQVPGPETAGPRSWAGRGCGHQHQDPAQHGGDQGPLTDTVYCIHPTQSCMLYSCIVTMTRGECQYTVYTLHRAGSPSPTPPPATAGTTPACPPTPRRTGSQCTSSEVRTRRRVVCGNKISSDSPKNYHENTPNYLNLKRLYL